MTQPLFQMILFRIGSQDLLSIECTRYLVNVSLTFFPVDFA